MIAYKIIGSFFLLSLLLIPIGVLTTDYPRFNDLVLKTLIVSIAILLTSSLWISF